MTQTKIARRQELQRLVDHVLQSGDDKLVLAALWAVFRDNAISVADIMPDVDERGPHPPLRVIEGGR